MKDRAKHAAYMRKWQAANPDKWKPIHKRANAKYRARHPEKIAFLKQRYHAKQRGLKFCFTFAEWLAWWGDDLPNRGRLSHNLVMARYDDSGAYEPANVRKITAAENTREMVVRRDAK